MILVKIVEQNSLRLVFSRALQHPSFFVLLGIIVVLFPFYLFGLRMLFDSKIETLTCQKIEPKQIDCNLEYSYLVKFIPDSKQTIKGVTAARMIRKTCPDGDCYHIQLQTSKGETYDLFNFSQEDQTRFNNFLDNPQINQLTLKTDNRGLDVSVFNIPISLFIPLLFCFFPIIFFPHVVLKETFIFDKNYNHFQLVHRDFLKSRKVREIPLQSIQSIELEKKYDSYNDPYYNLYLMLLNNKKEYIIRKVTGREKRKTAELEEMGQILATFLRVELTKNYLED